MGMWMKCPRPLAHIEVTYFLHIIWIQLHVFFCRILLFLHFFCIFDQKESFWQTFAPFFLDLSCNSILFANYCISFANWCIDLAYSGSIFSSIHCNTATMLSKKRWEGKEDLKAWRVSGDQLTNMCKCSTWVWGEHMSQWLCKACEYVCGTSMQ